MAMNLEILKKYKNSNIFVETGTHHGDGVQNALDAGYKEIFSIECKQEFYNECYFRFKNNKNVKLFLGDSSLLLESMIDNIKEPVTFWLDAHFMWNDPLQSLAEHPGQGSIPLIKELEQIKNHSINTHTIMIDDINPLSDLSQKMGFPSTGSQETKIENLIKFVKTINSDYDFELDGEGILICRVEK